VRSNQSSANRGSDVGKSSNNSRVRKNTTLRELFSKGKTQIYVNFLAKEN